MPLPLGLVGAAAALGVSAIVGVAAHATNYKYRQDEGLDFLEDVSSEDLNLLVEFLTKRSWRTYNEELSKCPGYKEHYPEHSKYWREIATEIQTFGGHTISNIYRGRGAPYRYILYDVCDRLKVNYDKASSIEMIELNLLQKTLADTIEKLEPTERVELLKDLGLDNASARRTTTKFAGTRGAGLQIAQSWARSRGFAPYKWAVKLVHKTIGEASKLLIGKGLPFAASPMVTKSTKLLIGPAGVVFTSAWTVYEIHSPAYRVTVPSVVYIAMLRQKQLQDKRQP